MMVTIIFIALAIVAAEAASISKADLADWRTYKTQYGKIYENEEEEDFRKQVYLNSSRRVEEHNNLYAEGKVTYEIGINQFSDLLSSEFLELTYPNNGKLSHYKEDICELKIFETPKEVYDTWDWREKGAVGPVKNQNDYLGCWAFSAVGALEGHHFLHTKEFVALSVQNLIDCVKREGDTCYPNEAFKYVKEKGGIDREDAYPYENKSTICRFNENAIVETISGCRRVNRKDEEQLKIAVTEVGPIAVSMYHNVSKYKDYTGGILYDEECLQATETTHALLLVGYGSENGQDYWLLKNSYGEEWGEKGYLRLARNKNSHCLIADRANFPVSE